MSTDPYGKPEKRSTYDTVLGGLRKVNFGLSLVMGIVFIVVGVGALITALVTGEQLLLPIGLFAIAFGGIRLWLWSRTR